MPQASQGKLKAPSGTTPLTNARSQVHDAFTAPSSLYVTN